MRSKPAHLGEISLDFGEIPPRREENFPYEHALAYQPSNEICFVFQMLIK